MTPTRIKVPQGPLRANATRLRENLWFDSLKKIHACSDSDENRTRVTAVKGRCLNRLTTEPVKFKKTPRVGLEPTTLRLTAECSTIELSRNKRL